MMNQVCHKITREENISAQLNLQDLCSDIRKLVNEKNAMREQNIEYVIKLKKEKELYHNLKADYENRVELAEKEKNATENSLYVELQKNVEAIEMKTHLQKQNQILINRVEELNKTNLNLKLQLQQAAPNKNLKLENEQIKIQCDRISNLVNILKSEITSVNDRVDQTKNLAQVLNNEHHGIKQRQSKTNALYLKQKQRIEETEAILRTSRKEFIQLQSLQLETQRDREHTALMNESLMQQIEQKDQKIKTLQSEINNNREMLSYFMEMHKKHCDSQSKLKKILHEYETDVLKLKELRAQDVKVIASKIKDIQELEKRYERKIETMQIEAVLGEVINKVVVESNSSIS